MYLAGVSQGFPVLILSGSAVGNSFAFLLIQERLLAMETGVPTDGGKITLETSGEDVKLHSKRVEKM